MLAPLVFGIQLRTIKLAALLGVPVVNTFSGTAGNDDQATAPNWPVVAWPTVYSDIKTWQWETKLIPYWREIGQLAQAHGAQIILLAGDLLDSASPYPETAKALAETFAGCASEVFLVPGNHDYYSAGAPYARLTFPENVHIFRSPRIEAVTLPELGVRVWGVYPDGGVTAADGETGKRYFGRKIILATGAMENALSFPVSCDRSAE